MDLHYYLCEILVLKKTMCLVSLLLLYYTDDDCDDDTEEFGNAATDLDSLGRDGNRFGVLGSAGHDSSSSDEEESYDESVENHDDYISIDGSGDTYEEESDDDDDNPFLAMPQFFEMFGPHGPRPRAPPPLDPQSSNIRPDNDAEESDDEIDSSAARCAACFRVGNQNHKWRRLGEPVKFMTEWPDIGCVHYLTSLFHFTL